MAVALYDLILLGVAAVLIPWSLLRRVCGQRARKGLRERLGLYRPERLAPLADRPVIWIHAVSVGETRAAIPLIKGLRRDWPGHALVLTNVTETGHDVAETIPELDLCLFFPLDLSWVIHRVLDRLNPQFIVIVETEIWPNLIRSAHRRRIPLTLVNGRISDRSFPRYRRFRRLLAPLLEQVTAFCMQTQLDAERIRSLGARPESVFTTGNLKFDMPVQLPEQNPTVLRELYRLPGDLPLWACGSTHDGEEEAILDACRSLLERGMRFGLILAPRHPQRIPQVTALLAARHIPFRLRSRMTDTLPLLQSGEVLLVDTLGELLSLYAASDFVFVGGSLVPTGGHNLLEAALVGRPVLFGPHMHNFREIAQLILTAGAGRQVASSAELGAAVAAYLAAPEQGVAEGTAGLRLIATHAGATVRTLAFLHGRDAGSR